MKSLLITSFAFLFLTAFKYEPGLKKTPMLTCTLKSGKTQYRIGELPDLAVEITNNTGKDIYLIGSLDASDMKWRMPYCYFTIEKPKPDTMRLFGRCGNMNTLRTEDFVLVKAGQKFSPYQSVDNYGFFTDHTIANRETFKNPGVYKIRFHYSTNSKEINDFMGDRPFRSNRADSIKLNSLFNKVPKVELESNEIQITFDN